MNCRIEIAEARPSPFLILRPVQFNVRQQNFCTLLLDSVTEQEADRVTGILWYSALVKAVSYDALRATIKPEQSRKRC